MKPVRHLKTVVLLIAVCATVGCSPKKEEKAAKGAAPQANSGASTATKDDANKNDAVTAAERVCLQMRNGDFAAIYKQSSPAFKQSGSEAQFVSFMKGLQQKTGALKAAKEADYKSAENKELGTIYSVTCDMEFQALKKSQIFTFVRLSNGNMALSGIHEIKE